MQPTQTSIEIQPRVFSVRDAAAVLGVSRSTLYELNKRGEIGFGKVGGRTVIPRSEIDRVLAKVDAEVAAQTGAGQGASAA